ncbi:TonB-dependent receptor [Tenuifilum sp.]|uniref:TonB-dependent receptor n=1 Tax=Tenuifilum sp. TaxID=2760880 RepID=UPI002D0E4E38|nr:carboxypeptidase-like regulatory domain-containing protein [Tenuifilum sp.]
MSVKPPYYIFLCVLVIFITGFASLHAQERRVKISGIVKDTLNMPIPSASVIIVGSSLGVSTDDEGRFSITVTDIDTISIRFSCLGYQTQEMNVKAERGKFLEVILKPSEEHIEGVYVRSQQRKVGNIERIGIDGLKTSPNVSGGLESLVKLLPGVSSSNELSSQYSVRGGNFDENLVYVNDVEVYRPFLIRSAQQEGLSFINPDMVGAVEFSSGGFTAEFGDKMSSVLNVRYREPKANALRVSAGLLGASATLEGVAIGSSLTYMSGVRYKTSRYILNSLETKGDYTPSFFDWQGIADYKLSERITIGLLGNVAINRFDFQPRVRETRFGVFNNTLQLKIYYDGQEKDRYLSSMAALITTIRVTPNFNVKVIGSSYYSNERETYDLLGQYFLNELDNSMGSKTYGDSLINVGIGGFLDHARNHINLKVQSLNLLGDMWFGKSLIKLGVQLQREVLSDELLEWGLVDSSGYAIPYTGSQVGLDRFFGAASTIESYRALGFVQADLHFNVGNWQYRTNIGFRVSHWSFNKEILFSPRLALSFNHSNYRSLQYHLSFGYYYQPPFYREIRLASGELNRNIKAQQSIHALAGAEYYFTAWSRPFRMSLEFYNKWLNRLIPYSVDNVRLRYSGENLARGYARGADLKINGELVSGAESWLSLSILKTKEDNLYDSYTDEGGNTVYPGYYFRPTDQTFSVSLFLQDYLPGDKSFRVNLTGVYGSGLPMLDSSVPDQKSFRMPSYKRIDVGFTKSFIDNGKRLVGNLKIANLSVGVDIFNLFNFNNTVSYLWVQTVANQEGNSYRFAVPNYLTSRRVNVRFQMNF